MKYVHEDFGHLRGGEVVEVSLNGSPANVQLVDTVNLERYRREELFHYVGGFYSESPVRLTVPRAGRWHLVIDLGGTRGEVRAVVRLLTP